MGVGVVDVSSTYDFNNPYDAGSCVVRAACEPGRGESAFDLFAETHRLWDVRPATGFADHSLVEPGRPGAGHRMQCCNFCNGKRVFKALVGPTHIFTARVRGTLVLPGDPSPNGATGHGTAREADRRIVPHPVGGRMRPVRNDRSEARQPFALSGFRYRREEHARGLPD